MFAVTENSYPPFCVFHQFYIFGLYCHISVYNNIIMKTLSLFYII